MAGSGACSKSSTETTYGSNTRWHTAPPRLSRDSSPAQRALVRWTASSVAGGCGAAASAPSRTCRASGRRCRKWGGGMRERGEGEDAGRGAEAREIGMEAWLKARDFPMSTPKEREERGEVP